MRCKAVIDACLLRLARFVDGLDTRLIAARPHAFGLFDALTGRATIPPGLEYNGGGWARAQTNNTDHEQKGACQ